jgi:hypothetical protein
MNRTMMILIASFGLVVPAVPQMHPSPGPIPAGTVIRVRTNEMIDTDNAANGRMFRGVVTEDATDRHGNVVIPRGSPADLAVREVSKHQLSLDLAAVTARGRTYAVTSSSETVYGGKKPGIGKNKRTAKFLGGGAAAGSVIGAIAGGGTGALVGGLVGAGAGAGAQTLTRGKSVHVPAESMLTFRLEQPLTTR